MKKLFAPVLLLLLTLTIVNPYSMSWIAGHLVVADDLEPSDAVLSLQSRTSLDEAARVLERKYAPILLVSVDSKPYYNQSIRELIEEYLAGC